jgi:hypothetical protein
VFTESERSDNLPVILLLLFGAVFSPGVGWELSDFPCRLRYSTLLYRGHGHGDPSVSLASVQEQVSRFDRDPGLFRSTQLLGRLQPTIGSPVPSNWGSGREQAVRRVRTTQFAQTLRQRVGQSHGHRCKVIGVRVFPCICISSTCNLN